MWLNIEDTTEGMKKSAIGQDEKIVFAVARLTDKYKQDEFIKTKKKDTGTIKEIAGFLCHVQNYALAMWMLLGYIRQ